MLIMLPRMFFGLRARLLALVLLAMAPAFAVILYSGLDQRRYQAQDATKHAQQIVERARGDYEDLADDARELLTLLAELPQVRASDPAACSAFMADLLKQHSRYTTFVAVRLNGDVYCSAAPLSAPVNAADRGYFQRALQTRDFVVGDFIIGRVTGKAALPFAYPVLDDSGQAQAVVVTALDLTWFNQQAAQINLPEGSAFTIMDRKGVILSRYPDGEAWIGKSALSAPIAQTILADGGEGTAESVGVDGVKRLYAFTPLGDGQDPSAYVYLGVPARVAYADANRDLTRNLLLLGAVAVLGLLAAWFGGDLFLLRRVKALVNATQRLSAGDLSARTGVQGGMSELSQLARAFDAMVDSLSQRERERRQAEETLRASEARYHLLFDSMLSGFALHEIICDEAGKPVDYRFLEINPAFERLTGLRAANLIGKTVLEAMPGTESVWIERYGAVALTGEPAHFANYSRELDRHYEVTAYSPRRGQFAVIFEDITARKRAEERIETQLRRLAGLRAIDITIASSFDLRATLNVVTREAMTQLGADAASALLFNPYMQTLQYTAGHGFRTQAVETASVRLGESFAGRAALERRIVQAADLTQAQEDPRSAMLWKSEGFVACCAAPLISKGKVKGVLEVFQRTPRAPKSSEDEWLNFLETLAGQAAIAVDNAQLFESMQRSNMDLAIAYDATIRGWSHALDLRDKETEGHTQRVTDMTVRLAQVMGLSDTEIVHIRRGALLHDIGKMGVPDNILLKPDKLTDEEWAIMRQHPQFAYDMLSSIAYLKPALDIPYCHHEKWDGTGYPRGLKGEQIPPAARIFAVVDVWDAVRSDRPYRKAWSKEQALAHIRSLAGTHFDPRAVELFLQAINE